jgi:hypothetical protein
MPERFPMASPVTAMNYFIRMLYFAVVYCALALMHPI